MSSGGATGYAAARVGEDPPIIIALVNNISGRGLGTTEAQFARLLRSAVGNRVILRCFTCPEVPRAAPPRTLDGDDYLPLAWLFGTSVDGLIVTGMEPQAIRLQDEPVWPSLVKLVDWVEARRIPTVWSCLAAHAAVLYLDGVARVPMRSKLSGVFDCETLVGKHRLTDGVQPHRVCPHSRYFNLPETSLAAAGYQILSSSQQAGADIFVRTAGAPSVFFQGHPEYDADSLLREYMRDLRRYMCNEHNEYPTVPTGYFAPEIENALTTLRAEAFKSGCPTQLVKIVSELICSSVLRSDWRGPAMQIYANWLHDILQSDQMQHRASHAWRGGLAVHAGLPR